MEQTEPPVQLQEHSFRVNFKQSAKGLWQAEYTVRANTVEELQTQMGEVKRTVLAELLCLNVNKVV